MSRFRLPADVAGGRNLETATDHALGVLAAAYRLRLQAEAGYAAAKTSVWYAVQEQAESYYHRLRQENSDLSPEMAWGMLLHRYRTLAQAWVTESREQLARRS